MTGASLAVDKSDKKRALRKWRERERAKARAKFPLQPSDLWALFETLNNELPRLGGDHTRRITISWLESHGHSVQTVCAWLDETGGFCDCEVLANSKQHFVESMRGSDVET
jgi:hypothetical protein